MFPFHLRTHIRLFFLPNPPRLRPYSSPPSHFPRLLPYPDSALRLARSVLTADANGMVEALVLWESVANSNWFAKSSMILFLNKADVFSAKIRDPQQQIHSTFPDYNGKPGNYQDGVHYFKKRFEGLSKGQKEVYVHVTTAVCPLLLGKGRAD